MKSRIPYEPRHRSARGRPRILGAARRPRPRKILDAVKVILTDVLLLEDELIIALDAELMLRELGAANVRVARTSEEGLALIESGAPSFALIDVNLGGKMSYVVAARLIETKTPFAFASGYTDSPEFTEVYRDVPLLAKPYGLPNIREAVEACLARTQNSNPTDGAPGGQAL